ncbi:MAG: hypothetical protein OQK76_00825 [Gammaproteobacteria bacterium]|nr:hypothetical protein [Gammaproteobacteria bacterium]MCW8909138.1 hypothetical protein [Gammaproteobacteria bacterium]
MLRKVMIVSKVLVAKAITGAIVVTSSIGYVIFSPPMGNIEGFSVKQNAPTTLNMEMFKRASSVEEYERDDGEEISLMGNGFSQMHVGE